MRAIAADARGPRGKLGDKSEHDRTVLFTSHKFSTVSQSSIDNTRENSPNSLCKTKHCRTLIGQ